MSTYELTPAQEACNHETRQPALWGCLISFLIINDVAIAARLWIKWRSMVNRKKITPEDIFIILSGIFVNAIIANLMAATYYGLGKHYFTVNARDLDYPKNLSLTFRHVWITMVLMASFFLSIKMTLLFFYKRLFLILKWKAMRIFWSLNLVYTILWWIGATGFYLFQCNPVQWYFLQYYAKSHKPVPGGLTGQCNVTTVFHVSLPVIFSLVSDVGLMVLPIWAISKLKLRRRRKYGLLAVFGVGAIACLLELARILDLLINTDDKTDPSWGVTIFLILTVSIETIAVVCACIPVIGPRMVKNLRIKHVTKPSDPSHGRSNTPHLRNWRNGSGHDGFTRFGSLNHVTDLEATIDQSWNDGRGIRGDSTQLTSFSGNNGVLDNAGDASDHLQWTVPHTYIQDSMGSPDSMRPGLGKIHVRTDVEIERSPELQAEHHSSSFVKNEVFATAVKH